MFLFLSASIMKNKKRSNSKSKCSLIGGTNNATIIYIIFNTKSKNENKNKTKKTICQSEIQHFLTA